MKHLDLLQAITDNLAEAKVAATAHQLEQLAVHLEMVLEESGRQSLTTIREPTAAARLHVLDSALLVPHVARVDHGTIVDVGTGAGYPGIPLAIILGTRVVLLESSKKKCAFLERVVLELGIADCVSVIDQRAEEHNSRYEVVVARAVSSLASLLELSRPLLVNGGHGIFMKGTPGTDEIASAEKVSALCGMVPSWTESYELPGGGESRSIWSYRAESKPRVQLPRRAGLAQRHPLG